jgi:sensor c-di-GMP phosphodiesterase-like protein
VRRVKRGIVLLIVGIILAALSYGSMLLGLVAYELGVAAIIFGIILLILWIWQILNAYSLAKQFNKAVEETGKEPW